MNAVINVITKHLSHGQNFQQVLGNDGKLPEHVTKQIKDTIARKCDRTYNIHGVFVELRNGNKQLVAKFKCSGRQFPDVVVLSNG